MPEHGAPLVERQPSAVLVAAATCHHDVHRVVLRAAVSFHDEVVDRGRIVGCVADDHGILGGPVTPMAGGSVALDEKRA